MRTASGPEAIIKGAASLGETFPTSALIVAAWKENQELFGLEGYNDLYPSSQRVLVLLMGKKRGMVYKGYLKREKPGWYSLTRKGKLEAHRLGVKTVKSDVHDRNGRKNGKVDEALLARLLNSTAMTKYQSGQVREITYADATDFWGIRGASSDVIDARLATVESIVAHDEDMLLSTGQVITVPNLYALASLDDYLRSRFDKHIQLQRRRCQSTAT